MSENKHTPEPWHISQESIDPNWSVVVDKSGNIVANVNAKSGPDVPPLVSTKMPVSENARLIASAPELLAALESCEAALATLRENNRWDAHPEDFNDDVDEAIDAHDKATAAIAKATGRA